MQRLECAKVTVRAHRSYGCGVGKTEQGSGGKRRRPRLNSMAQKHKEATQETSPRQREAEDVHARAWKRTEGRSNVAKAVNTVHRNYRIAIHFQIQITPKFV